MTNRFEETLKLFSQVSFHSQLRNTMMIVFLNKKDILDRKIQKVSFKNHFSDFSGDEQASNEVIEYMREKIEEKGDGRQIYSHVTCATDRQNVEFVFDAVNDAVLTLSMTHVGLH